MANLSDYQQVLTPNYGLPPTIIVKGQGCELFGQTGERYLDPVSYTHLTLPTSREV